MSHKNVIRALEDLKAGRLILVIDDEERENEGDLICAGRYATPENINMMATYGKGLICMPCDESYAKRFNLHPMVSVNDDLHQTAFSISIDHVDTRTGISAFERSLTVQRILDENSSAEDFRRPGHLFPLIAKNGGVLVRPGHTEATVDLCRLAGLEPVGLCCEIMDDDGQMMRNESLLLFAHRHELTMISIAELQDYRKVYDRLVSHETSVKLPTAYGDFTLHGFVNRINGDEHLALVKGEISDGQDILCRVHSECLTGDVFRSQRCDCGEQLEAALRLIAEKGRGIILYLRQEGRGIGLINKLRAYELQEQGMDTLDANLALGFGGDEREYYIGAQILQMLNVKSIDLLTNNPDKIYQLEEYGMRINQRVPLVIESNEHDDFYLKVKQERMGHLLGYGKEE